MTPAIFRALCDVVSGPRGWKSCAHLSITVREALEEEGATEEEIALVAAELGVGLKPVDEARRDWLRAEGLLP